MYINIQNTGEKIHASYISVEYNPVFIYVDIKNMSFSL